MIMSVVFWGLYWGLGFRVGFGVLGGLGVLCNSGDWKGEKCRMTWKSRK